MGEIGYVTYTMQLTSMSCPSCGVIYGMSEEFRQRALKNDNIGWYCTNGHRLSYQNKSKIEQLEMDLANARDDARATAMKLEAERSSHSATKGQLTKAKKQVLRAEAGVCTICKRSFPNVRDHYRSKHKGEFEAAEVAKEHGHTEAHMASDAKSHWENWKLDDLRVLAHGTYGITNVKKYKKQALIHQMRIVAQEEGE